MFDWLSLGVRTSKAEVPTGRITMLRYRQAYYGNVIRPMTLPSEHALVVKVKVTASNVHSGYRYAPQCRTWLYQSRDASSPTVDITSEDDASTTASYLYKRQWNGWITDPLLMAFTKCIVIKFIIIIIIIIIGSNITKYLIVHVTRGVENSNSYERNRPWTKL